VQTRFTALVGCSVPIQQAPMGGVSSPDLAVAVADAGDVGTVSALGVPAETFVHRLDDMLRRTSGVLSANVLLEDTDEDVMVAAAERVRVVDFFWFDPSPRLVELVHRAGRWSAGRSGLLTKLAPRRMPAVTSSPPRDAKPAVTFEATGRC
jgi:nitronate monooxygenase